MPKILLIDDSEAVLEQLALLLRTGGFEVTATTQGRDAVAVLGTADFDVILTDLYMPPPDGFEIIQAAQHMAPHVPLIVMSTNPTAVDVFRAARALGAVASLQKPFSAERLFAAIEQALARARALRGLQVDVPLKNSFSS